MVRMMGELTIVRAKQVITTRDNDHSNHDQRRGQRQEQLSITEASLTSHEGIERYTRPNRANDWRLFKKCVGDC